MTRIGVGGLINMKKMEQAHVVLNDIQTFHRHAAKRQEVMAKWEKRQQLEHIFR